MFRVILILALLCLIVITAVSYAQDKKAESSNTEKPDVLVAVLTGMGLEDNVVMDYSTPIPPQEVQRDLIKLSRLTGWKISGAQASAEQPGAPGAKATTGASFTAPAIVITNQGTLPLEPFIMTLKRYRNIELDYIVGPEFTYRGLKDFENDYVKIKLRQTGTTYRFAVTIKNKDFEKLDLPATQVEQEQRSRAASTRTKIFVLIGLALLAAVAVFFIMRFTGKNRQQE